MVIGNRRYAADNLWIMVVIYMLGNGGAIATRGFLENRAARELRPLSVKIAAALSYREPLSIMIRDIDSISATALRDATRSFYNVD